MAEHAGRVFAAILMLAANLAIFAAAEAVSGVEPEE
jgi:hypothetical protein